VTCGKDGVLSEASLGHTNRRLETLNLTFKGLEEKGGGRMFLFWHGIKFVISMRGDLGTFVFDT